MEDVITLAPPPSRFFPDDLDTFSKPPPPPPTPFLLFSPAPNPNPIKNPNLLLIAISPFSLSSKSSQTLAASLFLPDLPLSHPNNQHSIHFYTRGPTCQTLVADVNLPIPANRAAAVASCLLSSITPRDVIILDSIQSSNYRGRLAADETLEFKLQTSAARKRGGAGFEAEWLPSGSVVDGLAAAVMAECEMRRVAATLVVTWPESGVRVKDFKVVTKIVEELGVDLDARDGAGFRDSELYT